MKLCQTCGQMLAEEITGCPSCGSEVAEGRKTIDDYRILKVLHEGKPDLAAYANQNAGSVAFVLVEYWLESDEKIYCRNRTEGTAFLADGEGYLLTTAMSPVHGWKTADFLPCLKSIRFQCNCVPCPSTTGWTHSRFQNFCRLSPWGFLSVAGLRRRPSMSV
ncbi:MAG: hypothetical protein U5R30_05385 [Deltaproteobacteria bacterium]|nr:hypothetical protein [Deltaproteobacteria bacterium]